MLTESNLLPFRRKIILSQVYSGFNNNKAVNQLSIKMEMISTVRGVSLQILSLAAAALQSAVNFC